MKVKQFYKGVFAFICLVMINSIFSSVFAAMDPVEVKNFNEDAPYQIVGKVTSDVLFQDVTKDKKHPMQIRKVTILISDVIKSPTELAESNTVDMYYHYIPSWDAKEYKGAARVDLAIGDVITVSLSEGEYGWEPAIGGHSIEHDTYTDNRIDYISEPPWHIVTRWIGSLGTIKTDIYVLCGLFFLLGWAVFRGLRKTA